MKCSDNEHKLTIEQLKIILKNYGALYKEYIDTDLKWVRQYILINDIKFYLDGIEDIDIPLKRLLCATRFQKEYIFKKEAIEYGTIEYGINELIEDLKSWL